jgi:hypothetical protein
MCTTHIYLVDLSFGEGSFHKLFVLARVVTADSHHTERYISRFYYKETTSLGNKCKIHGKEADTFRIKGMYNVQHKLRTQDITKPTRAKLGCSRLKGEFEFRDSHTASKTLLN